MHTGMMWLRNKDLTLAQNIQAAANYYLDKFGKSPDVAMVHPSVMPVDETLKAGTFQVEKVTVRPYRPVLPGHIWIGIEDKS